MLTKVHYQDDHEELVRQMDGQMSFLIDDTRPSRMIKTASQIGSFTEAELDAMRPDKDHFGVLFIGMGARERYGHNKNNDAYGFDMLKKCAHTFVTHGHYFYEHQHNDPKKAIGSIKLARLNEPQYRVELFVWGHKKKAAEQYERAKKGETLNCSMGAKVKYDVCSCCGNKAPTPQHYCSHMRKYAGQYLPEFKKYVYVDNPDCIFFDLSDVANPADRIGRYLAFRFGKDDEMLKAASHKPVILGHEWADFQGISDSHVPPARIEGYDLMLLQKLAREEKEFEQYIQSPANRALINFMSQAFNDSLGSTKIARLRQMRPQSLMLKLASRGIILPLADFLAYMTGSPIEECRPVVPAVSSCLPGIFREMCEEGCLMPDEFSAGAMDLENYGDRGNDPIDCIMEELEEKFCAEPDALKSRTAIIIIKTASEPVFIKRAANSDEHFMAHAYGRYLLSTVRDYSRLTGKPVEPFIRSVIANNFSAHS
jgi:hypothetical protein